MSDADKCPHCGAEIVMENMGHCYYACGSSSHGTQSDYCVERAAHAETRKQYMELIMAVARKFDGETRHQTALRYIKHAEDRAREAGKADAEMNRLDAEANGGQR